MGGQTSSEPRVVTVETNEDDGMPRITVTQDFVNYVYRQQRGGGREQREEEKEPPGIAKEDPSPFVSAQELLTGEGSRSSSSSSGFERARDDGVWKEKYEQERAKNQDLKNITEREFDSAVADIKEKFSEKSLSQLVPVCVDCKEQVLQCLKAQPSRPLMCSSEVQAYTQCVARARKDVLATFATAKSSDNTAS